MKGLVEQKLMNSGCEVNEKLSPIFSPELTSSFRV